MQFAPERQSLSSCIWAIPRPWLTQKQGASAPELLVGPGSQSEAIREAQSLNGYTAEKASRRGQAHLQLCSRFSLFHYVT